MYSETDLIEKSVEAGAHKASIINVEDIPFDENLRSYCEANACGHYGKNHECPPDVGDVALVIAKAKLYSKALIFQTVSDLEDSFDIEGMRAAEVVHSQVGKCIGKEVDDLFTDCLQLTVGVCTVCAECTKLIDEPCRFPDKAISSLEAYCMNVVSLSELCGMNYINGQNTVTYFGAFLFDPENSG